MKDFAKRKKINTKNSKNRQAFGSIKTGYNGISKNTIMFLITAIENTEWKQVVIGIILL